MTSNDSNLIKTPLKESSDESQNPQTVESTTTEVKNIEDAGEVVNTEHVNEGDLAARSPDRRDQIGQPFDGSINEHSMGSDNPQSEDLHTLNRYANVDNAQTRVLSANDQKSS
ncbi:hypothetical protein [Psychrobacter sp. I-STPA10]|uniref:hypothetical protein n=1 Tax=Psychrobacter sp. I-STPA10 TaxID=2585769 RepID=UPI001E57410A|nr:hypothetical protein [Psychrobacter sp. I-STPA10]